MLSVLLKRLYIAIIVPYYRRLEKSPKKKKKYKPRNQNPRTDTVCLVHTSGSRWFCVVIFDV